MSRIAALYVWLLEAGAVLAAACVGFMALGVTADVAVRAFNLGAIKWMLEVCEYLMFAMTFLGAPWVLREGAHAGVDILVDALPAEGRRICGVIANLLGLVMSLGFAWYGGIAARSAASAGTMVFKGVVFPEWWILAFIPFCGVLLSIEFVLRTGRALRGDDTVIAKRQATA